MPDDLLINTNFISELGLKELSEFMEFKTEANYFILYLH